MFLRALLIGLIAVGAVHAAPTAQSTGSIQSADTSLSQTNFDLIGWLRRQVYQEEKDLVVKSALHSWLLKNPQAAQQAQSELEEFTKTQESANQALKDALAVNATELMAKNLELETQDLATRRQLLSQLSTMDESQIKQVVAQYQDEFNHFTAQQQADSKFTTSQTNGGDTAATLKQMLEQSLANEEEGLENYRRAYELVSNNPELAAQAEVLRASVFQRMLSEGQISARAAEKAEEMGATQALNKTVYMKEKIVQGMKIALEMLESQPEQVPTITYQIQQMMQDPDFITQQMSNDDSEFDTMQFGGFGGLGGFGGAGALQSMMPLLARQA